MNTKIETTWDQTPLVEKPAEECRKQELKIWKNVTALVGGVGIFTMGLNPIDDLQSSLNGTGGLGVASLSIKYAFMILGNLLTNTLIIRKLGSKPALVWGSLLYSVYIVANFYPTWSTLVPLTIVAGMGGALMWTTLGHYLATLANQMAALKNRDPDSIKALFFGFKGGAVYSFAAFGGLASSLILEIGIEREKDQQKRPFVSNVSQFSICGANYCNEDFGNVFQEDFFSSLNETYDNETLPSVTNFSVVHMLCCFCLISSLVGVLLMLLFVDPLPKTQDNVQESPLGLLLATVKLWKTKQQLLLIPISFVYGFQEAFWRVEFSKAYITCAMGIQHIGFLMVCYNVASLISSMVCGHLGQKKTRSIVFPVMAIIDVAALTSMLYWRPTSDDTLVAYITTGVTGTTYGALSTLLMAFYGIVFPNNLEAAYSNLYFWSFLGSTLMYAWSYVLCLRIKLIIVLVMVVLGLIGYIATELTFQTPKQKKEIINNNFNSPVATYL